uniref:Uncharacterized protein n=1 Tax=Rhizophora mucronata TaxID=61149 RepID=A0A2P2R510_RHIMU
MTILGFCNVLLFWCHFTANLLH